MTTTDIRRFLGLDGYYRRFLESFSSISSTLMKLTQQKVKFLWFDDCKDSFERLNYKLTFALVLTLYEGTNGFIVYYDVNHMGQVCVLMQHGILQPILLGTLWFMRETIQLTTWSW